MRLVDEKDRCGYRLEELGEFMHPEGSHIKAAPLVQSIVEYLIQVDRLRGEIGDCREPGRRLVVKSRTER